MDYDDPTGRTPYCSALANYIMAEVGFRGTRSAAALSWRHWGKAVPKATIGAVTVFDHGDGTGHVTFYFGKGIFWGGNQTKAHEVCKEHIGFDEIVAWRLPMGVE